MQWNCMYTISELVYMYLLPTYTHHSLSVFSFRITRHDTQTKLHKAAFDLSEVKEEERTATTEAAARKE